MILSKQEGNYKEEEPKHLTLLPGAAGFWTELSVGGCWEGGEAVTGEQES